MISKRECFCAEQQVTVEAIVEEKKKTGELTYKFLRCGHSSKCCKSTFCRFVNPLTTRNPLEIGRISAAG
ncbi:MAG: hypothetical protein JXA52_04840 [Planctomycetes bacterium]|nr:hypothetical protein [Planctomycetota bacterium]